MKKLFLLLPILLLIVTLTGCSYDDTTSSAVEQQLTEENQAKLLETQPPVKLEWSLERENINRRTSLWNNPDKMSYIYLVSYGKVMAFHVVKGKVSSVNSQITNPEQAKWKYSSGAAGVSLPSPAEDGSYGTNGDGIFFFTPENAYVEWAGEYMISDQPLKLATPPALVREIK